jgi:putative transposase
VLVVSPGRRRGRRPWVTLFLVDCSRAIMGWAISLQPSSAEVLAALRDATLVDSGRGPFGGLPGRLRWDHGLEFAAPRSSRPRWRWASTSIRPRRMRRTRGARSSGCTA